MRLRASSFSAVSQFFPECEVIISDLEAAMEEAETQMLPEGKGKQEEWMNAVIQEMLPVVCLCH